MISYASPPFSKAYSNVPSVTFSLLLQAAPSYANTAKIATTAISAVAFRDFLYIFFMFILTKSLFYSASLMYSIPSVPAPQWLVMTLPAVVCKMTAGLMRSRTIDLAFSITSGAVPSVYVTKTRVLSTL